MSEELDEGKLESILGKVRGLLDTANHPNTTPEMAETYRTKAEALMFKYRLDEATASGFRGDGQSGFKPVWRRMVLGDIGSEFDRYYRTISASCVQHVGARSVTRKETDPTTGKRVLVTEAVGYESDLRYMDMLMTAALLEFSKRLEPTYDRNISLEENIYNMRHAGMERKRIAKIVFGDWKTENEMKAKNRKVTNIFKAECERRGEDHSALLGRGNNMATYRESYADGFVNQFWDRLTRMRQAHGAESGALVLASRKENVDEAFYEKYPTYRPASNPAEWVDPRKDCKKCQRAVSGYCREHQYLKPSTRVVSTPFNDRAYGRGADAARAVDLGPNATGTPRTGHTTKKEIG